MLLAVAVLADAGQLKGALLQNNIFLDNSQVPQLSLHHACLPSQQPGPTLAEWRALRICLLETAGAATTGLDGVKSLLRHHAQILHAMTDHITSS